MHRSIVCYSRARWGMLEIVMYMKQKPCNPSSQTVFNIIYIMRNTIRFGTSNSDDL